MSRYTQNYQLHQWEAGDDFLRTDFNEDFAKIDTTLGKIPDIVKGSYTGDGESSRDITLGFAPKLLYVCTSWGQAHDGGQNGYYYGGLAMPGQPVGLTEKGNALEITENGFRVSHVNSSVVAEPKFFTNVNGMVYYYIAIR